MAKEDARREQAERGISDKYRRRKWFQLSPAEKVGIAHAAIIQLRFYRDIADEFHVSVGLVSRIARKAKAGKITDQLAKLQLKINDRRIIGTTCLRLLERDGIVTCAAQVRDHVQANNPCRVSKKQVYQVMKNDLGFKFKRNSPIAVRTNIVSCRYQRQ